MASKKRKVLEVDLTKEFFTEEEVESLSETKTVVKLGSFWSGGRQLFRVSLADKLPEKEDD